MTSSFVYLTPPGGSERDERSVTVRDGFAFLALLCPPLWFCLHRLWFEALASLLALMLAGALGSVEGLSTAGPLLAGATLLFSGLEARNLRIRALERRGFRIVAALAAANREEAEEIFFSRAALRTRTPVNSARPATGDYGPSGDARPVLGLFDLHGGR